MDFQENPLDYKLHGTAPCGSLYSPPYNPMHASGIDSFAQLSTFPADEVLQMHHLRFPTPPTTPPKEAAFPRSWPQPERLENLRTQSVIMKIGQEGHHSYQVSPQISVLEKSEVSTGNNAAVDSDYLCSWINCRRIFENMESLATHVTKVHAVASVIDGLYYCRWEGCPRIDRGFNARYKMLVHVRTHTKEKPHRCHLCHKCFSRAENLKIHIRSHSGEKPYICTYEGCHKAYSNSSDRFKHTRTHSMEKPYVCKVPGCLKRYTDPSSLRKHVKTFKHAEQLIDVNHISQITSTPSSISPSASKTPKDKQYYSDLISPTIYNEQGCERRDFENYCHMEVDDFKYCYLDKQVEPRNWWQRTDVEKTEYTNNYFLEKSTEYNLNLNIELPLDLRKKRIL